MKRSVMTLNSNYSVDRQISLNERDAQSEVVLDASIHKNLTDEEIDRKIDEIIAHTNNLIGVIEQYNPSSSYYRVIFDELHEKKVTANGLKYPYEITEEDSFFPSNENQVGNQLLGKSDSD